jgi:hypothetical protein
MKSGFTLLDVILVSLAVGAVLGLVTWFSMHGEDRDQQECQIYCNCTVTKDCLYTFDYWDVKDCNCSK